MKKPPIAKWILRSDPILQEAVELPLYQAMQERRDQLKRTGRGFLSARGFGVKGVIETFIRFIGAIGSAQMILLTIFILALSCYAVFAILFHGELQMGIVLLAFGIICCGVPVLLIYALLGLMARMTKTFWTSTIESLPHWFSEFFSPTQRPMQALTELALCSSGGRDVALILYAEYIQRRKNILIVGAIFYLGYCSIETLYHWSFTAPMIPVLVTILALNIFSARLLMLFMLQGSSTNFLLPLRRLETGNVIKEMRKEFIDLGRMAISVMFLTIPFGVASSLISAIPGKLWDQSPLYIYLGLPLFLCVIEIAAYLIRKRDRSRALREIQWAEDHYEYLVRRYLAGD